MEQRVGVHQDYLRIATKCEKSMDLLILTRVEYSQTMSRVNMGWLWLSWLWHRSTLTFPAIEPDEKTDLLGKYDLPLMQIITSSRYVYIRFYVSKFWFYATAIRSIHVPPIISSLTTPSKNESERNWNKQSVVLVIAY